MSLCRRKAQTSADQVQFQQPQQLAPHEGRMLRQGGYFYPTWAQERAASHRCQVIRISSHQPYPLPSVLRAQLTTYRLVVWPACSRLRIAVLHKLS